QRRRGLAQPQVTEPDVIQYAQAVRDLLHFTKETDRLANSHVQHFVNILPAITNVENLLLEARAFALLAHQLDVGKKLHLHGDRAVALANLAAPAWKIEREVRRIESSRLCFTRARKDFADRVVHFDVRHWIRTWRAPNRRLIDEDHIVDKLPTLDLLKSSDVTLPLAALFLQTRVETVVNQRRLSRTAHTGDANEHVERYVDVDRFEVVFGGALNK